MTPNDLKDLIESVTGVPFTQDEIDPYIFYYVDPDRYMEDRLKSLPVEIYKTSIKDKVEILVVVYNQVGFE